jgi:rod shape determining protein RodA
MILLNFGGFSSLFKLDVKLLTIVMSIVIIGLITLYSVSNGDINLVIKQIVRILIGMSAMVFLAQIHPDNFRLFSPVLYSIGILLLIPYNFFWSR